jgi:hypothetical protein
LIEELRPLVDRAPNDRAVLRLVERRVNGAVPYSFDWETWGVVDYLPSVGEAIAAGREDCDGRAVVAASLLRKLGYEAELAWDGAHMWVWTPRGEAMSPNAVATVRATADGRKYDWSGIRIVPRALAFGLGVFPLIRELIVLVAVWLVLLHPGIGWARAIGTGVSLVLGLMLIRVGGRTWDEQMPWVYGAGYVSVATVVCTATVGAARARARGRLSGSGDRCASTRERIASDTRSRFKGRRLA